MNHKMNIPKIILEHRKKNKHIMEFRKNLPKKSLSEIAEAFEKLHEEEHEVNLISEWREKNKHLAEKFKDKQQRSFTEILKDMNDWCKLVDVRTQNENK